MRSLNWESNIFVWNDGTAHELTTLELDTFNLYHLIWISTLGLLISAYSLFLDITSLFRPMRVLIECAPKGKNFRLLICRFKFDDRCLIPQSWSLQRVCLWMLDTLDALQCTENGHLKSLLAVKAEIILPPSHQQHCHFSFCQ